jgi:iron-sulfur cluster assembly protein
MEMIEVTDVAAEVLRKNMVEGRVIRMILVTIDASGANYVLAWGDPLDDDVVFENNGIEVHMSPEDADLHGDSETIIDYVDTEYLGTGFVIHGPEEDAGTCDLDCHACGLDCHHE